MCHQTVGLVQAELERSGIATASLSLLPEIAAGVGIGFGELVERILDRAVLRNGTRNAPAPEAVHD